MVQNAYDVAVKLHKDKFGYEPVIYGEFWQETQEWFIEQVLDAIDSNIPYVEVDPEANGIFY